MNRTVFYALAVKPDLPPQVGAAPYRVLARQIPRMVVLHMNGDSDRGLRFFPFIGPLEGRRQFLDPGDLLPAETLLSLHGKEPADFIVDGRIEGNSLRLRIHDGASGQKTFDAELPFDPAAPAEIARRILFELTGALRWQGGLPSLPEISELAWAHLLVARDDLLGLEANLEREDDGTWVRAAGEAIRLAPAETKVQEVFVQIAVRLLRRGTVPKSFEPVLIDAFGLESSAAFRSTLAGVMDSVAAISFQQGRFSAARALLESVATQPNYRTPELLMRLAIACQRTGDPARYDELVLELTGIEDLPVNVARVLAVELAERGRLQEAAARMRAAIFKEPEQPALWLELARIHLQDQNDAAAREALQKCLAVGPKGPTTEDARRLLRLCESPETYRDMIALDHAMSQGELKVALAVARRLVRRQNSLGESWLFLGVIRHKLGHRQRARRALARAVEVDPELGEAHNRLGILLVELGQHQAGYEHLRHAVRLLPDEPAPQLHLVQACHYMELADEAADAFAAAERLGADPALLASVREAFLE